MNTRKRKSTKSRPGPWLPDSDVRLQRDAKVRYDARRLLEKSYPIKPEAAARIAKEADCSEPQLFYEWINELACVMRGVRDAATPALEKRDMAVKEQLSGLRASLKAVSDVLRKTNGDTFSAVAAEYGNAIAEDAPGRDERARRRMGRDLAGLARLYDALVKASATYGNPDVTFIPRRGRPSLDIERMAAKQLALKYEELSGQRFTFYAKRVYTNVEWSSPGSRFVAAGLDAVFPGCTNSNKIEVLKSIPRLLSEN